MIGLQTDHQKRLFYSFDLEEHVHRTTSFAALTATSI